MQWMKVQMNHSRQVQEMVPHIARQLIANGIATEYKGDTSSNPQSPVIETAIQKHNEAAAASMAAFVRGPKKLRPAGGTPNV